MDMSQELFWTLNPTTLKPYVEAYKLKKEREDAEMWRMGIYVLSAVRTGVENVLAGRKAKAEYLAEPLMQTAQQEAIAENMSEDEQAKQVEMFFMKLDVLAANSRLEKKIKNKESDNG